MLKSTLVILSSEGGGTKISRRFWNSSKVVDILKDGGWKIFRRIVSVLPKVSLVVMSSKYTGK